MKANYFKFGVFLVIATALLLAAIVILGAGLFEPEGQYFETYFDRSVAGLNPGASVQLQGVKIGRVESIGFASEVYDIPPALIAQQGQVRLVRVVFSVDRRFAGELSPAERQARRSREVHSGLRVRLASNLITGQSYLLGTYVDPNRFPASPPAWEPEHPYAPSVPSQMATLTDSIDRLLAKLDELDLQKLFNHVDDLILTADRAVEDANVAALQEQMKGLLTDARGKVQEIDAQKIGRQVEDLMANADGAVTEVRAKLEMVNAGKISQQVESTLATLDEAIADANMAALAQEARTLLAEARVTNTHLRELLARPDQNKELANLAVLVDQLNTTLRRANLLIATQTPRLEGTLENFRKLSGDMKDLSENLKRNPSNLLFGAPPRESELLK